MRLFTVYRPSPPDEYYAKGAANPPDEPQFEGVVFTDGTACVRWLTDHRSHSVWSSLDDLLAIHGHPEYGTRIEWADELHVTDEKLAEAVFQSLGQASMCWDQTPAGIFDSEQAKQVGDNLIAVIHRYAEWHRHDAPTGR